MISSPLKIVNLWEISKARYPQLLRRSEVKISEVLPEVRKIVTDVGESGDSALLKYTKEFDGVELTREQLQVSKREFEEARGDLEKEGIRALENAAKAIERYHRHQLPEGWMEEFEPGVHVGQIVRPIESVGIYVPGGRAQYPSSLLMSAVPANVAKVQKIVVCTPPNPAGKVNAATLTAAEIIGVDEIFKAGGAQAIAAMAYGTKKVPRVDKIVGPGGIHVTAAKKVVFSDVDVDFAAGPSEVLILADSSANPRLVALDMIAQAEHDPSAASILVTSSKKLAKATKKEIGSLLEKVDRRRIATESLKAYGRIVVTRSLKRAIKFANDYAPEHLQLMVKKPKETLEEIKNAGAIFLGPNSPTAVGDYGTGPSHVLPTGGAARYLSGLSILDFLKLPSVQRLTKEGLETLSEMVEKLADLEGLPTHALSIRKRLE